MMAGGRGQQIVDGGRHHCAEGQRAKVKGRQPQLESLFFLFLPFLDMIMPWNGHPPGTDGPMVAALKGHN